MTDEPSVNDCLNEIRRLRAENERLNRLVQTQRPELKALRDIEVGLRSYLCNGAQQLQDLHIKARDLLPGHDDLRSTEELGGIWSDGKDRVDAALKQAGELVGEMEVRTSDD